MRPRTSWRKPWQKLTRGSTTRRSWERSYWSAKNKGSLTSSWCWARWAQEAKWIGIHQSESLWAPMTSPIPLLKKRISRTIKGRFHRLIIQRRRSNSCTSIRPRGPNMRSTRKMTEMHTSSKRPWKSYKEKMLIKVLKNKIENRDGKLLLGLMIWS